MEQQLDIEEDSTLAVVRRRGLQYLNYALWVMAVTATLVAANLCASLFGRWVAFLEGARRALGIAVPVGGPDYWILSGASIPALLALTLLLLCWRLYRRAWSRRLSGFNRAHVKIRRRRSVADDAELKVRTEYLCALAAMPEWRDDIKLSLDYKQNAENVLKTIEEDIATRAVTAGLVVGLNRNYLIDSVSILAAALELQFFVLTCLGKEPSLRTWMEMLKRTGSSLFLNWYVSREDALSIKLAIKTTAWGLGFASDVGQHAGDSLHHLISHDDIDWDELTKVAHLGPLLPQIGEIAAYGLTIGASGLQHIRAFIDTTADDLLQGVLAGGILYYHGMALAAECLALDEQHRQSREMSRTISQAMSMACTPAGRVLLDQVRAMRQLLRQRRTVIVDVVKAKGSQLWDKTIQTVADAGGRLRPLSWLRVGELRQRKQ